MMPKTIVHLLSGGMDSVVMLYDLHAQGHSVHCVLFDYGQKHAQELTWAKHHCHKLGVLFTTITLPQLKGSELTDGSGGCVVPNRNAILLSLAVNLAVSAGAESVTYACNKEDEAGFPDCRMAFVQTYNNMLRTSEVNVEVCAPYIDKGKWWIAGLGREMGIDFSETWSCYRGGSEPCGECAAWPGRVGLLLGPSYFTKTPIDPWMPFALDNDAFSAWRDNKAWDFDAWYKMLERVRLMVPRKPEWILIPDVVGDRERTLEKWELHTAAQIIDAPKAFAVQDGMTPDDVPNNAEVVFVGGTDGWKFPNLPMWTTHFKRVHCARVNSPEMFLRCQELGCESIDGTGWFRDPSRADKLPVILRFLEGSMEKHPELAL